MKHILNDLTEQEKNAIREHHSGGMNVVTENFHRLLGSKLGYVKPLVSEQLLPGLSSGNSAKAVADIFRSCTGVKVSVDPKVKQSTDSIYKAIQGLGTDEQAIMQAFSSLRSKNEFCGVNKTYLQTYGTNLYTDLDGDIDQETEWASISRILRNLQIDPKIGAAPQKTGPGGVPQKPGVKPTGPGVPQKPGVKPTGGAQKTNPQTVGNPAKPTGGAPITQQGNPGQTFPQQRPSPRPTR
jgi:hypothetical protein